MLHFFHSAVAALGPEDSGHGGAPVAARLSRLRRSWPLGLCLGVALATAACDRPLTQAEFNQLSLSVEAGDRPGVYELSGQTSLPEETELTVQALRRLTPTGQALSEDSPDEHYTILDRDRVKVEDGQWRIALQLWQPDGQGEPAESWQLNLPQSDRSFTAEPQVLFSVSMPPTGDERALEGQWEESKRDPTVGLVSFTPDGEWYLEAQEQLPIAPPAIAATQPQVFDAKAGLAKTDADIPPAKAVEGPLGEGGSTTSAPLKPTELMR